MQQSRPETRRHARAGGARRRRALAAALLALADCDAARATIATDSRESGLPEVVVGTTPLPGTAAPIDELPSEAHSLDAAAGDGSLARNPTEALGRRFAGIGLEDALSDRFQASLAYRGFVASPVLGTPQALAVYQDGVRLNEAFGDVVNWDLVPAFAVRRVDVVAANPVYGANALGGAVVFTMKDGSSDRGLAAELERGSFDERAATLEYGGRAGGFAYYAGARALGEDGARRFSSNSLRQLYADLRYATTRNTIALSLTGGRDRLEGPGAAPIQELAVSRSLTFTVPQQTDNRLGLAALRVESQLDGTLSLAAIAYYRQLRQDVVNGNTSAYRPCTTPAAAGLLCQPDGATPLTAIDGSPVPDPTAGGAVPLGENDSEMVRTTTTGGSMQLAKRATLLGRSHVLALGAVLDSARIDFAAGAQVGSIDPQLQVAPGGPIVGTPEGTPFRATPIDLGAKTRTLGWHASDTLALTPRVSLTASAQYATEAIDLADRRGSALTGSSRYQRLNPALGLAYHTARGPTLYAGYAETTRAPSPSEIACSDPARPCLLPSTLAGDPPLLRQVVARTWETGARQAADAAGLTGLGFSASAFRADLADDIYGVALGAGRGYFANIGVTRRQGLSLDVSYRGGAWSGFLSGAIVDATFQSAFSMPSPQNPFADANGSITVRPGSQLPGVARVRAAAGIEWRPVRTIGVGATVTGVGPSRYHGDESNQNPELPGYARVDLYASLAVGEHVELAVAVSNLLDAHYASYGLYGDPTGVGAPGVPPADSSHDPSVDTRFQSPAAPAAWRLTLRVRL